MTLQRFDNKITIITHPNTVGRRVSISQLRREVLSPAGVDWAGTVWPRIQDIVILTCLAGHHKFDAMQQRGRCEKRREEKRSR